MQGKTASIVESELSGVIEKLGYELYEVEYAKKQNGMNLTLYITKPEGVITLKDCELVHRTVDGLLDELNPTNDEAYYLNVSSVGLDKPLKTDKDFKRCLGVEVTIKLFVQMDKNKEIIGILKGFDENCIMVEINGSIINIERQNIAICKQNIKF